MTVQQEPTNKHLCYDVRCYLVNTVGALELLQDVETSSDDKLKLMENATKQSKAALEAVEKLFEGDLRSRSRSHRAVNNRDDATVPKSPLHSKSPQRGDAIRRNQLRICRVMYVMLFISFLLARNKQNTSHDQQDRNNKHHHHQRFALEPDLFALLENW